MVTELQYYPKLRFKKGSLPDGIQSVLSQRYKVRQRRLRFLKDGNPTKAEGEKGEVESVRLTLINEKENSKCCSID
jgi:hypothetical protein